MRNEVAAFPGTSRVRVHSRKAETRCHALVAIFGDAAEQQFTAEKVAKELQRYRRKGIGATTRLLRDGPLSHGPHDRLSDRE
jgi:hypothetical protein